MGSLSVHANVLRGRVHVSGDNIPSKPTTRQMINSAETTRQVVWRLVGGSSSDSKAETLRRSSHCGHHGKRLIHRPLGT